MSLVVSILSLVKGKGINLARVALATPLWGHAVQQQVHHLAQRNLDKHWLFFQSQAAALGFSLASLLVFFMLLVATDVNFVWRSTILDASDILPLLEMAALPWYFWESAQPSIELLLSTQDSRLLNSGAVQNNYAAWWPFVLATQVFYCVILRSILLISATQFLRLKNKKDFVSKLSSEVIRGKIQTENHELAKLVHELPHWLAINNWAGIDLEIVKDIEHGLRMDNVMNAGPLASEQDRGFAARWQGEQVILVKAWEPPLGELADYMANGKGFIWPIDWKKSGLINLKLNHLNEWRRFVAKQTDWQVYLPASLLPEAESHKEIVAENEP